MAMRHVLIAVAVASALVAYGCGVWVLAAWARYWHKVLLMMLETRYGWADAKYLVARKARQEYGQPRRHRASRGRAIAPEPVSLVQILPPDEEADPAAFARPEEPHQFPTGEWPAGELYPESAADDTEPGREPLPATHPAHTMTMTQPVPPPEMVP
jgi:hypothetical protein